MSDFTVEKTDEYKVGRTQNALYATCQDLSECSHWQTKDRRFEVLTFVSRTMEG